MQYKFIIAGVPVFARELPSGALSVWHPYNDVVRAIVEPICRPRGYWRATYNNWIVRAQFREAALGELAAVGVAS